MAFRSDRKGVHDMPRSKFFSGADTGICSLPEEARWNPFFEQYKAELTRRSRRVEVDHKRSAAGSYYAETKLMTCLRKTLVADVNMNHFQRWGRLKLTPLYAACHLGDEQCVHALLVHGADPNLVPHLCRSPLVAAVDSGNLYCVKALLQSQVALDVVAESRTALFAAIQRNDVRCATALITAGASMYVCCQDMSPLMLAVRIAHREGDVLQQEEHCVKACLRAAFLRSCRDDARVPPNITNDEATLEAHMSRSSVVKNICNFMCDSQTALHIAATVGDVEVVKYLLQMGRKTEVLNGDYRSTPLQLAAEFGNVHCMIAILSSQTWFERIDVWAAFRTLKTKTNCDAQLLLHPEQWPDGNQGFTTFLRDNPDIIDVFQRRGFLRSDSFLQIALDYGMPPKYVLATADRFVQGSPLIRIFHKAMRDAMTEEYENEMKFLLRCGVDPDQGQLYPRAANTSIPAVNLLLDAFRRNGASLLETALVLGWTRCAAMLWAAGSHFSRRFYDVYQAYEEGRRPEHKGFSLTMWFASLVFCNPRPSLTHYCRVTIRRHMLTGANGWRPLYKDIKTLGFPKLLQDFLNLSDLDNMPAFFRSCDSR